jgi:hypothetical protein
MTGGYRVGHAEYLPSGGHKACLPTGTRLVARLESTVSTSSLLPFIFNNYLSFHQYNGKDGLTALFS